MFWKHGDHNYVFCLCVTENLEIKTVVCVWLKTWRSYLYVAAMPAGGHYSAQQLIELSASHLARQAPPDWDQLIHKFEREGIEGVLLRHKVDFWCCRQCGLDSM